MDQGGRKGRQRKYLYATDGKLERNGNERCNRCAVRMTDYQDHVNTSVHD